MSRLAIVVTVSMWVLYLVSVIVRQFFEGAQSFSFTLQAYGYLLIVTLLTFSALMYLIARQGALQRFAKHIRVPRAELDRHFSTHQPPITVLIPSYAEEPSVIRKTILSAALQEYPKKRIVLLIDDNPRPTTRANGERLAATRALPAELNKLLSEPAKIFADTLAKFERSSKSKTATVAEIEKLAGHYAYAADWLNRLADSEEVTDHVDTFFCDQVLRGLSAELDLVRQALTASAREGASLTSSRIHELYQRLAWIFGGEVVSFERKTYASLSHEANKAMNLNSYIGLMGGAYKYRSTPDGPVLVPTTKTAGADLVVPDSEFLLTLDADSILLRDYCLRLVYFLQQPDNARVAVTQTPYSSFRGSSTRIERLAGATTDIQHILHQGMTHYGATFWVGANAVIRKIALDDIVQTEYQGGYEVKRYIQDRTVIEDTESSIDLTLHGWTLINYPERLSYSATPPDFGSLIIQRRRWANGGLLILPKLVSQTKARKTRGEMVRHTELMLRLNYMASIAWASFGLIFLLAYPFYGQLLSPFVLLAALPYFLAMAQDLHYCGYKRSDVFRIYGFNIILLPVNLAGVLKSLQQALSSKKIPFARTPKVKNRTISPLLYVITPLVIVAFSLFTLYRDELTQNWANAAFASFNAVLATWAILAYIGVFALLADIWRGLTDWMYVEVTPKAAKGQGPTEPAIDWRAVLYHGEESAEPQSALSYESQELVS
jgi:cellulose synthase/poly-beta-1,6-N-acetylglucosamine synthase-like glycosyltransferase